MIGARLGLLLAVAACAGGCATYRYGTHQIVEVVTDPPGASCRFERFGREIARVDRTPGQANVERSLFLTRLACSHPYYFDESVELLTERAADIAARDPARLNDVILDNVAAAAYQLGSNYAGAAATASSALGIGLYFVAPIMFAIDLTTSAGVGFRPPPVILMSRSRFRSEADRDDHYAIRRRELETQAARLRGDVAEECWSSRCTYELRQFDRAFDARLERLEMQRLKAAIVETPPP